MLGAWCCAQCVLCTRIRCNKIRGRTNVRNVSNDMSRQRKPCTDECVCMYLEMIEINKNENITLNGAGEREEKEAKNTISTMAMCAAVNSVINVGRWQTIATRWQPNGNNFFRFVRFVQSPKRQVLQVAREKNTAQFRNSIFRISHCHSCSGDMAMAMAVSAHGTRTTRTTDSGETGAWWHFHKNVWTLCATVCALHTPIALRGIDIPVYRVFGTSWTGSGAYYAFLHLGFHRFMFAFVVPHTKQ